MSISTKKIHQMISDEFSSTKHPDENVELLIRLAKDVYAIESGYESGSDRQKIDEIRSKLSIRANEFTISN